MTDPDEVIPPLLLERRCDCGRSDWSAEEILKQCSEWAQQYGPNFLIQYPYYPGCGARFQWYGFNCGCSKCGRSYLVLLEDIKSGKFTPEKQM